LTDISELLSPSIISAVMTKAESTSEMLVYFYKTTWDNIPESSHIHICHCENLKSHASSFFTTAKLVNG
jgi:hypothetical protein